jgi:filamentous hemagglutinin family protein
VQPSASSVTLNRVLDTQASQILGRINANGQVFLSNPNGVLFGPTAQVDVGGLLVTTHGIGNDDFMAGKSSFEGTGKAASVVNQGQLQASLGGYIALLAPQVRNEGVIVAKEGTVALAAGDKVTLQFAGQSLTAVQVDRAVVDALVDNQHLVRAEGGYVVMTARSANALLQNVVKNSGIVQAPSLVNRQGRIVLEGGSLGRVEDGFSVIEPSQENIADLLETHTSDFGELTAVRHAALLQDTPTMEGPAMKLGSSPATWLG